MVRRLDPSNGGGDTALSGSLAAFSGVQDVRQSSARPASATRVFETRRPGPGVSRSSCRSSSARNSSSATRRLHLKATVSAAPFTPFAQGLRQKIKHQLQAAMGSRWAVSHTGSTGKASSVSNGTRPGWRRASGCIVTPMPRPWRSASKLTAWLSRRKPKSGDQSPSRRRESRQSSGSIGQSRSSASQMGFRSGAGRRRR